MTRSLRLSGPATGGLPAIFLAAAVALPFLSGCGSNWSEPTRKDFVSRYDSDEGAPPKVGDNGHTSLGLCECMLEGLEEEVQESDYLEAMAAYDRLLGGDSANPDLDMQKMQELVQVMQEITAECMADSPRQPTFDNSPVVHRDDGLGFAITLPTHWKPLDTEALAAGTKGFRTIKWTRSDRTSSPTFRSNIILESIPLPESVRTLEETALLEALAQQVGQAQAASVRGYQVVKSGTMNASGSTVGRVEAINTSMGQTYPLLQVSYVFLKPGRGAALIMTCSAMAGEMSQESEEYWRKRFDQAASSCTVK